MLRLRSPICAATRYTPSAISLESSAEKSRTAAISKYLLRVRAAIPSSFRCGMRSADCPEARIDFEDPNWICLAGQRWYEGTGVAGKFGWAERPRCTIGAAELVRETDWAIHRDHC